MSEARQGRAAPQPAVGGHTAGGDPANAVEDGAAPPPWPALGWPDGWWQGWWAQAQPVPSPNHGPRPAGMAVELLVLHSISLPPGQYGGPQVAQLFTNTLDCDAHPYFAQLRGVQVSAHFLVRRDGQVLQFVSALRRAWHAGPSQWRGRDNCNDWSVGIELEGLEGQHFEPAQYAALRPLVAALARLLPLREAVGHEQVAPLRKADPGPGFDWPGLCAAADWPPQLVHPLR